MDLGGERVVEFPQITGAMSNYNVTEVLRENHVSPDILGFLYRRTLDTPYCEGKYGGLLYGRISETPMNFEFLPERGASVSAPVIMLCGLHMLFFWRHDSGLLHLIATLFAINGVSSFFAHYTGLTVYHNIDGKSMQLAVWLAFCMLMSEFLENTFAMFEARGPCCSRIRDFLASSIFFVAMMLYYWVGESNSTVGPNEYGHRIGALSVAFPLVASGVVFSLTLCCGCARNDSIGERSYRIARNRFILGVTLALLGATAWIATENFCDGSDSLGYAFKWFPGHLIWHLTCAYGLCQTLLLAGAMRADNFNTTVHIDTSNPYFMILPKLEFSNRQARQGVNAEVPSSVARQHTLSGHINQLSKGLVESISPGARKKQSKRGGGGRKVAPEAEALQPTPQDVTPDREVENLTEVEDMSLPASPMGRDV